MHTNNVFMQVSIGFLHIVVDDTLNYNLGSQPIASGDIGVVIPSILVPLLIVVTVLVVLFVIML